MGETDQGIGNEGPWAETEIGSAGGFTEKGMVGLGLEEYELARPTGREGHSHGGKGRRKSRGGRLHGVPG